jgi:hypothetical protein
MTPRTRAALQIALLAAVVGALLLLFPRAFAFVEHLRAQVPEFRRKESLAYPLAGVLAPIALAMFRRVVVSCAQAWLAAVQTRQTRWSVRRFQTQFARRDGGAARLDALVLAKAPTAWRLAK